MAYGEFGLGGIIVKYLAPEHVLRGHQLRRKTPIHLLVGC